MGTKFFHGPKISPGGSNLFARAISAPSYAARAYGGAASKNIGAAAGLAKGLLKPTVKDAASDAPGPRKV